MSNNQLMERKIREICTRLNLETSDTLKRAPLHFIIAPELIDRRFDIARRLHNMGWKNINVTGDRLTIKG